MPTTRLCKICLQHRANRLIPCALCGTPGLPSCRPQYCMLYSFGTVISHQGRQVTKRGWVICHRCLQWYICDALWARVWKEDPEAPRNPREVLQLSPYKIWEVTEIIIHYIGGPLTSAAYTFRKDLLVARGQRIPEEEEKTTELQTWETKKRQVCRSTTGSTNSSPKKKYVLQPHDGGYILALQVTFTARRSARSAHS